MDSVMVIMDTQEKVLDLMPIKISSVSIAIPFFPDGVNVSPSCMVYGYFAI